MQENYFKCNAYNVGSALHIWRLYFTMHGFANLLTKNFCIFSPKHTQWTAWTPPVHLMECVFMESATAIRAGAATIARSWRLCVQTSAQDTEPTRRRAAPAPVTPTGLDRTAPSVSFLHFCTHLFNMTFFPLYYFYHVLFYALNSCLLLLKALTGCYFWFSVLLSV